MKPVQVSQLNKYIKSIMQTDPLLSNILVIGEISNLKYHSTGHVYFSLKDKGSRINCFLPENRAAQLRYPLEEGMEIIAAGYINIFEKNGSYSLNIKDIRVEGEGSLAAAFELLKKKLGAEGLFDEDYKMELPQFPKTVGIATSATGAAVWDMVRTIRNKNDYVDIVLCPCLVQGDGAAPDIVEAIRALNRMETPPDVIIIGRGGGSREELWAFNEERVARAIFDSEIPVMSAVGHETDFTIADFVADMRAATPTAAAEAAVPDMRYIRDMLEQFVTDSKNSVEGRLELLDFRLEQLAPERMSELHIGRIENLEKHVDSLMKDSVMRFREILHREELRIEKLKSRVDSLNPERILELGYAVVTDNEGKYIKTAENIKMNDIINVGLADGDLVCRVEGVSK